MYDIGLYTAQKLFLQSVPEFNFNQIDAPLLSVISSPEQANCAVLTLGALKLLASISCQSDSTTVDTDHVTCAVFQDSQQAVCGKQIVLSWIMHVSPISLCLCCRLSIKSVVTFTDPSEKDLGLYTVEISDDLNLSSSYDFTAEGR